MSPASQFPNRFNVSSRESYVVSIHMRSFIWTFQSICKILPTSLIILKYLLRCYIVNYTVFYWSFVKRKLYETKSLKMFFIGHARLKFTSYTSSPCILHEWTKVHWILQFIESSRSKYYILAVWNSSLLPILRSGHTEWGRAYSLFDNHFNLDLLLNKDWKILNFSLIEVHRPNWFLSII